VDCIAIWETGARLGKARITSLDIFRLSSFRFSLSQLLAASQLFEIILSKKRALIHLLPRQQSNDATAFQFDRFSFSAFSSDSLSSQLLNASTNS